MVAIASFLSDTALRDKHKVPGTNNRKPGFKSHKMLVVSYRTKHCSVGSSDREHVEHGRCHQQASLMSLDVVGYKTLDGKKRT